MTPPLPSPLLPSPPLLSQVKCHTKIPELLDREEWRDDVLTTLVIHQHLMAEMQHGASANTTIL